jgi:hypothetical protein
MKQSIKVASVVVLILALGACTAGSVESAHAASGGDLSQFFLGVWHGLIAPVMLIIEVIDRLAPQVLPWTVRMYEAKGTGVVYDVGFYLGLAGSPVIFVSRWRRPRS